MCTFNGAAFLREQLDSLAAQARLPDELIVCDDRSTDATAGVVEEFAASAPFPVRLFVNERNLGSTKNFERAISLCTGEIIALCDQDDVWLPGKLARAAEVFAARSDVGAVYADAEVVEEDLRPRGERLWQGLRLDPFGDARLASGDAFDTLIVRNFVTGATMAFRSRFRDLALPIPERHKYIHDGWLAVMIAAAARVLPLGEPSMLYRQHTRQQLGMALSAGADAGATPQEESVLEQVRQAATRAHPLAEELEKCRVIRERLTARQESFDVRASLRKVESRMTHLAARVALPDSRLRRVPRVLRELLTLRYHRYSRGLRSAAKDFLF